MALMDELSARLYRQDGASFNEEVLPLCCRYSSTQLVTLNLTLTLTRTLTLARCCRCGKAIGGPRRAGST